jgi:hypothetical protein
MNPNNPERTRGDLKSARSDGLALGMAVANALISRRFGLPEG